MPLVKMQPTSATGKKRPRSESSGAGASDDDVPIKKKVGRTRQPSRTEIANTILQKYKDDALAACNLQKYPEVYEQVKAYVLKASMAPSGNKIGKPSIQAPYAQLKQLLNNDILEIPPSLAEAVRVMCPNHKFTPALMAQMISLGWDPALICHPTKSAKERLAASKEEQMKKHGVDQADVDKNEDALILRKRLAGVGKHGSLDGYVDPDLEMVKQVQDNSITLHITNLQNHLAIMQRQLAEINNVMTEVQHKSIDMHQSQIAEAQNQLTEINSKMGDIHQRLIDTHQSQKLEMQRQSTNTHQSQIAEIQRQLTTTHQTQMAEIQRHLANLIPHTQHVLDAALINAPGRSFLGPDPVAYYKWYQQQQQHQPTTHGLPMPRPGYGYQRGSTTPKSQNSKTGHYSPSQGKAL